VEVINVKGVSKGYKNHSILSDVNLLIEEGDFFGVIGTSGSGKTTLLNILAGFIEPTSGKVMYWSKVSNKEESLHKNLHKIKKFIGFTPQHTSFYHKLTVSENLLHFAQLYNLPVNHVKTNITNILKFTNLFDHKDTIADNLSGGQQKILDIACSLAHRPKIIILDEPTANLDHVLQRSVLRLLKEVNAQGITVVMASHDLNCIEEYCSKVAVIHNGKVHSQGNLEEIRKPYLTKDFTIQVHAGEHKAKLIEKIKTLPINKIVDHGSILEIHPRDVQSTMSQLMQIIKDDGLRMHHLNVRKQPLHDIFDHILSD